MDVGIFKIYGFDQMEFKSSLKRQNQGSKTRGNLIKCVEDL